MARVLDYNLKDLVQKDLEFLISNGLAKSYGITHVKSNGKDFVCFNKNLCNRYGLTMGEFGIFYFGFGVEVLEGSFLIFDGGLLVKC